jgi:hypothetical protein
VKYWIGSKIWSSEWKRARDTVAMRTSPRLRLRVRGDDVHALLFPVERRRLGNASAWLAEEGHADCLAAHCTRKGVITGESHSLTREKRVRPLPCVCGDCYIPWLLCGECGSPGHVAKNRRGVWAGGGQMRLGPLDERDGWADVGGDR